MFLRCSLDLKKGCVPTPTIFDIYSVSKFHMMRLIRVSHTASPASIANFSSSSHCYLYRLMSFLFVWLSFFISVCFSFTISSPKSQNFSIPISSLILCSKSMSPQCCDDLLSLTFLCRFFTVLIFFGQIWIWDHVSGHISQFCQSNYTHLVLFDI
jgi:hypothetical protein